jgi:hypothetical protein
MNAITRRVVCAELATASLVAAGMIALSGTSFAAQGGENLDCNSVQSASSPSTSQLLGLLNIALDDVTSQVDLLRVR